MSSEDAILAVLLIISLLCNEIAFLAWLKSHKECAYWRDMAAYWWNRWRKK